nr:RNA-directed DNA polymerase, eukaryota [Tanacetum cinerariifolium]
MDFPKKISESQLRGLECEVSNDEIKKAVWDCGTEKAPGPGGFTLGFFRHFWYLIHNEVYDAVSLIGSIYKIVAKILANRLVGVLDDIVNEVQSAFIADRQILDGPFILNEVIQWCKVKKKQVLIFKVDFEKAYDSVRWDFLDEVLRKFGFGDKWCKWIQCCLNFSRGSILVNGSPTEEFQFGKCLKQCDPLSLFLFILIMESLHLSFQRIVDEGMFKGIKLGGGLVNLSHMFYAHDAVFAGQWCENNITTLVHVLDCFYKVSGLRINMSKSKIMGVHVDAEKVNRAATKLGCLVFKISFAYLGSIVGGTMSRMHLWNETVDKVKKRLSKFKMNTLSIEGHLTLIKSVLSSTLLYHLSLFKAPMGVLNYIESLRSHFFNGHDIKSKKATWVNWKKVLVAKDRGGLGISSLYAMNRGLLLKWVWRFVSQKNTLWARVIQALHGVDGKIGTLLKGGHRSCWTSIIQEMNNMDQKGINFMSFIRIKLGNGAKTRFWEDKWCDEGILKIKYPRLFALESCKLISVGTKLSHPCIYSSFRRKPRGGSELDQLARLGDVLKEVILSSNEYRWVWDLESTGGIFGVIDTGICIDSILCATCDRGVETASHLFFSCSVARDVVKLITRWWCIEDVELESFDDWENWFDNIRLPQKNKKMLEGVFFVTWWYSWSFRNKILFDAKSPVKALLSDEVS